MTPEDRDRLIEAGEELKRQRTLETCLRTIVMFQGREWAPGCLMKSRYFIVNVPKDWAGIDNPFDRAQHYINSPHRFPLFYEMHTEWGRFDSARVTAVLPDLGDDAVEIT